MVLSSIFRSSYKASLLWPLTLLFQDSCVDNDRSKKFDTFSHVKILNWITSVNFFLPDNIFHNYYYKMWVPLKVIALSATIKLLCFKFGLSFQRLTFWVFDTICVSCLKFVEVFTSILHQDVFPLKENWSKEQNTNTPKKDSIVLWYSYVVLVF